MPARGPRVHAGVHVGYQRAFMQAVNAFMQAASSLQPPGVVWDLQYALY